MIHIGHQSFPLASQFHFKQGFCLLTFTSSKPFLLPWAPYGLEIHTLNKKKGCGQLIIPPFYSWSGNQLPRNAFSRTQMEQLPPQLWLHFLSVAGRISLLRLVQLCLSDEVRCWFCCVAHTIISCYPFYAFRLYIFLVSPLTTEQCLEGCKQACPCLQL